ncbi:cAMP-dependent protein kinase type 3 [Cordyceps fumosorosea ARSEF 2679]|uniref:cAMP-dependent protein kinase n=1 Tax=Cordyceps fumosorosea (strain ARSEF 2679) TaxID=1081104 RepID=A0A168EJ23_CORFA|nr:cAMP-dependent protein kinase type 3 [Cordyceps fumosorosea ARSEF 2679]OAA73870.1 cAMP-dependent protein kinase type 3 [Cordyceps fumosorosea ARSEF 2679]
MPGLGFLKKKRTREGTSDPSTSNPTSPVAPTNSKPFDSSRQSVGSAAAVATAASQAGPPSHGAAQSPIPIQATTATSQQQAQAASEPSVTQQEQQQQQPPLMNPVYGGAGTLQHQNLPTISNLMNTQQPDPAAANINNYPNSHYPANLAPQNLHAASESPGTDPERLGQQQQQAHPIPGTAAAMQPQQHHQVPLYQQAQQMPQQNQGHHQHQVSISQPRTTKGKYSLTDFDILRTLGTGSFGRVHLVQSKHNQRFYAIKVLKKAQVVKMKQVEHTNDERRMLSDVKHPFLITLWGTFQDWKNLYMVMDFVEGGELFSLLRKSGRFPNPVAKFYAAEATLALEYLHSKNIIYRDLKPENLLLDRHGHLKITDFGFAKRVPDKTWTLCGTPDYLAPEVVSNKGYNKSVDWWSLGILIYEMLCGYTPFWDSGSPMRIYENILKGKVKYPAYVNGDAQNLLERLITADLTKRLGNLYGGPADVKNHPWFAEVTWDRLARKDIDAPYTPPVKAGTGDASQFDRYAEDPDGYGHAGGPDDYGHLFTEF